MFKIEGVTLLICFMGFDLVFDNVFFFPNLARSPYTTPLTEIMVEVSKSVSNLTDLDLDGRGIIE